MSAEEHHGGRQGSLAAPGSPIQQPARWWLHSGADLFINSLWIGLCKNNPPCLFPLTHPYTLVCWVAGCVGGGWLVFVQDKQGRRNLTPVTNC